MEYWNKFHLILFPHEKALSSERVLFYFADQTKVCYTSTIDLFQVFRERKSILRGGNALSFMLKYRRLKNLPTDLPTYPQGWRKIKEFGKLSKGSSPISCTKSKRAKIRQMLENTPRFRLFFMLKISVVFLKYYPDL